MSAMDALFAVQDEDTIVGQLGHRHAHLSERRDLADAEAARAATAAEVNDLKSAHLDLYRRQRRYEGEVTAVEDRLAELDGMLYGGSVTSPKEAVALQNEIGHLRQRLDSLEGTVLETMEELEPVDKALAELSTRAGTEEESIATCRSALLAAESTVDGEVVEAEERRALAAGDVPTEVLARYERARISFGASAVVHFAGGDCNGCPYSMPAVEADRVRALDVGTLAECSECGRLVVR